MSRPRAPISPALRAHVLAGGISKDFDSPHRLSKACLYKQIHALGFKRYYLTDDEARHILERRGVRKAQP